MGPTQIGAVAVPAAAWRDRSAQTLAPPQSFQGGCCLPAERRLGGPLRQFRQHIPRRRRGDPLQQLDGSELAEAIRRRVRRVGPVKELPPPPPDPPPPPPAQAPPPP